MATEQELDARRVTMQEYVAYITTEVAFNQDGIAWARVNRHARPAELYGAIPYDSDTVAQPDVDSNIDHLAPEPGLLRAVLFPFASLQQAFDDVQDLGQQPSQYAKDPSQL